MIFEGQGRKKWKGHQLKAVEDQGSDTRDVLFGVFLVYYVNQKERWAREQKSMLVFSVCEYVLMI